VCVCVGGMLWKQARCTSGHIGKGAVLSQGMHVAMRKVDGGACARSSQCTHPKIHI
jgi:hypothetical protein